MTQAQKQIDRRRRAVMSAERAERDRKARRERFELMRVCAQVVGLNLVNVALGPQYDSQTRDYIGLGGSHLDVEKPKGETHGRRTVKTKDFNPRAYEHNTSAPYYSVPIPTPAF